MSKKDDEAAPVLIRERRLARGIGGGHWEERVRVLEAGEPIPDGARVVEGEEPGDWQAAQ